MDITSFNNFKFNTKNRRLLKVAKEIKVIISELLLQGKIKNINLIDKSIIITDVEVVKDLSEARVFVETSFKYNEEEKKQILKSLNEEKGFFKKVIGRSLKINTIPNIRFIEDTKMQKVQQIESILNNLDIKPE